MRSNQVQSSAAPAWAHRSASTTTVRDELAELGQLLDQVPQLLHVGRLGRTFAAQRRDGRGGGDEGLIEHRRRAGGLVPREGDAQRGSAGRDLYVPGGDCVLEPLVLCRIVQAAKGNVTALPRHRQRM